jgi:hypothetical protein
MRIFLSAAIAGIAAALIGHLAHSAVTGFAALAVIAVVFIGGVTVVRRRRQATAA